MLWFLISGIGALESKTPVVAVEIAGDIPVVLQVSVGESLDTTLQLSGIVGPDAGRKSQDSDHPFFIGDEGLYINIGSLKIFSNHLGGYSISISSQNNGFLVRDSGGARTGIRYALLLDGHLIHSESGVFEYEMGGKSEGRGSLLQLDLLIDDVPAGLQNGRYSDWLAFAMTVR